METKRLNKAISETGYCSRREADRLIEGGEVKINGVRADLGTKVTNMDTISVSGKVITKQVENIYLAFNKPVGITCTTDLSIKDNIVDYINYALLLNVAFPLESRLCVILIDDILYHQIYQLLILQLLELVLYFSNGKHLALKI